MKDSSSDNLRLRAEQLAAQMLDGNLSAAEQAELLHAIDQDATACDQFVRQVALHAVLRDEVGAFRPNTLSGELFGVSEGELSDLTTGLASSPPIADVVQQQILSGHQPILTSLLGRLFHGRGAMSRAAAAMLLVTVLSAGALLGALATAAVPQWRGAAKPNTDGVVALMTSFEGARWTEAGGPSSDLNSLVAGQRLDLTAGSAQSTFGFGATIVVQGPASFTPVSKKAILLNAGKLMVDSPRAAFGFTVKTPRMEVVDIETPFGNRTSFGLDTSDDAASLHVFQGEVCVWISEANSELPHASGTGIRVQAGEGLTLDVATSTVKQIASDATVFMPSPSEKESDLVISDEYVSAIKAAKPVAYWRFEQATSNAFVNNEMPAILPLRICGDAQIEEQSGNGRAVFAQSDRESWLKTDDVVKSFAGDYALELWMKANSYQNGALVSLTTKRLPGQPTDVAALLELIGPDHLTFPPGGIRYLNREPAGITGGTNLLSTKRYLPKQWHHLVATKSAAQMSLYFDGKQVGMENDPRRISIDPQVVLGRLHSETDLPITRPFVGQLDEIAIYDRALKAVEVENHFALGSAR